MDMKSFLNRMGMTKAELCRRLGIDPKSSVVGAYEKGRSNPSFEICEKLIPLGITAQELFGKKLGDTLVSNSSVMPSLPPEIANNPEFAVSLDQALKESEAKIATRVKNEILDTLKTKGVI